MGTNAKWDALSISEWVSSHNIKAPNGPTENDLFNRVVELIYRYPQQYFGLEEENAAEFVLDNYDELEKIISNYNPEQGAFEAYIYSIIRTKVKAFRKKKRREYKTRILFETFHAVDYYSGYMVRETPAEADSLSLIRLKYIFKMAPASRRKFFIMFLSLCPYMEVSEKEFICSIFNFNIKQTMALSEKLSEKCSSNIAVLEHLRYSRTLNFSKYLLNLELEINDIAMKNLSTRDRKNSEISRIQKRACYRDIGEVLNLNVGTVGNYMHYARNVLAWVSDVYSLDYGPSDMDLPIEVFNQLRSLGDDIKDGKNLNVKEFFPVREFKLEPKSIET